VKKVDEFNATDRIDIKLLESSTHFLSGEITEESVNQAIKWLIYESLQVKDGKVLTLYVNSTGGDLYQALALIDVMRSSGHTVRTVGIGAVMSAAFLIFAAGDKGERYAAKNTSFMCHQFSSSTDAKYHDIKAEMKENEQLNNKMITILKDSTGMAPSVIKKKLLPPSDVYLTAEEVLELNIADHIL
jgi:ATP-dependent Clp protease, protease subunit